MTSTTHPQLAPALLTGQPIAMTNEAQRLVREAQIRRSRITDVWIAVASLSKKIERGVDFFANGVNGPSPHLHGLPDCLPRCEA